MDEEKNVHKMSFKEWVENYWYHYRPHTIAGIIAFILIIFTLVQCAMTVDPDVTIDLVTATAITDSEINFSGVFSDVMEDADRDGEKKFGIIALYIPEDISSEQDMAMQRKMMLELAAGEAELFIYDKINLDKYINQDAYAPLSDFIDITPYKDIEGKLIERDGVAYAISLKGSKKLSELNFKTDELYAVFHFVPENSLEDEYRVAKFKNAAAVLEELLK